MKNHYGVPRVNQVVEAAAITTAKIIGTVVAAVLILAYCLLRLLPSEARQALTSSLVGLSDCWSDRPAQIVIPCIILSVFIVAIVRQLFVKELERVRAEARLGTASSRDATRDAPALGGGSGPEFELPPPRLDFILLDPRNENAMEDALADFQRRCRTDSSDAGTKAGLGCPRILLLRPFMDRTSYSSPWSAKAATAHLLTYLRSNRDVLGSVYALWGPDVPEAICPTPKDKEFFKTMSQVVEYLKGIEDWSLTNDQFWNFLSCTSGVWRHMTERLTGVCDVVLIDARQSPWAGWGEGFKYEFRRIVYNRAAGKTVVLINDEHDMSRIRRRTEAPCSVEAGMAPSPHAFLAYVARTQNKADWKPFRRIILELYGGG